MKGKLSSINYQAFQDLLQKLRAEKKICSARAQGIGKSYLIVAFCDEYEKQGKKVLILSTTNRIFDHQIAPRMTAKNVIYATYQATLSNNFVIPKVDLVIADEFHRLGGEVWRMKFEEILNQNPNVEVLGISAEYERGDGRCMDIELFNGHMYENIPMGDAFIKGIYKFNVNYIMTYYKLDEPFQGAAKKFMEMNNLDPNYIKAKEMWEKIRSEWHMVNGVPTVIGNYAVQALHDHFTPDKGRQKIAIFVERLDQVEGMDSLFTSWFTDSAVGFKKVNIHKLSSRKSRKQNDMALKEFMTPRSSIYELDILVSVNMLNEGVHVSNLNAVMFLRGTKSPVLYRQQLGRCFDSVKTDDVIVFDFVGNWETATGYKVSNKKLINDGLESIPEPESPLIEVHNKEEEYRNTVDSNYEPKLKVFRLGTPIINFINVLSKLLGRNTGIDYEAMCKGIIKNKTWDEAKRGSNPNLYQWILHNKDTNPYAKIIWDHISTKQPKTSCEDYEAMCKDIIKNEAWDKAKKSSNFNLYTWIRRNRKVNPYAKIVWDHIKRP